MIPPVASRQPPYILIYQMGKVGCVSLYRALREHPQVGPTGVAVLHTLNQDKIRRGLRSAIELDQPLPPDLVYAAHTSRIILDELKVKPFIISPFREPIGRAVSAFFFHGARLADPSKARDMTTQQLVEHFLATENHDLAANWYGEELHRNFGIDVFATPFDAATGVAQHSSPAADALIFRHDLPDDRKAACIAGTLSIAPFTIERANTADDRGIGDVARRFRTEAKLPAAYIERMYSTRYAEHFFSDQERAHLTERWSLGQAVAA